MKTGPFPIDQELIAEYTLIDVRTEEEAADWALRMPIPAGLGAFQIEIRELEDKPSLIRDPKLLAMEVDLEEQLNMLKKESI